MKNEAQVNIGILGGGQLARMLALAAHAMGRRPFIFCSKNSDCASEVGRVFLDDGTDNGLTKFISQVDLVIIENEFLDVERVRRCLGAKPIFPSLDVIQLVQDKRNQKREFVKHKIPSLPFFELHERGDLEKVVEELGRFLVLKAARFGYDGKGTFIFSKKPFDAQEFWSTHGKFNGYAEPFLKFKKELAVVVARSVKGEVQAFPVVETFQKNGICEWAVAPASVSKKIQNQALAIAEKMITKLGGVGVFGVEMFLDKKGNIQVNEIAPRVHNSGHWTLDGCVVSQFEQHLRAVLGLKLAEPKLVAGGAAMVNIVGRVAGELSESFPKDIGVDVTLDSNTFLHWYGKTGAVMGRKLGHINAIGKTAVLALKSAQKARARLKI